MHQIAFYLVLLAVVGAAAAAFVGVGDVLEGKGGLLRAATSVAALCLLLLGSAVRAGAAQGSHPPVFAFSAVVLAVVVYAVPAAAWLVGPFGLPRRAEAQAPQPVSP